MRRILPFLLLNGVLGCALFRYPTTTKALLSGTTFDGDGRPIAGIYVAAVIVRSEGKWPVVIDVATSRTDANGAFSLALSAKSQAARAQAPWGGQTFKPSVRCYLCGPGQEPRVIACEERQVFRLESGQVPELRPEHVDYYSFQHDDIARDLLSECALKPAPDLAARLAGRTFERK